MLATAFLIAVAAPRAPAQTADELIASGIQAYDNLDFEAAAGLLRRGLSSSGTTPLEPSARALALTYLAATEFFRGNADSARAVFARLVRLDPRHRIDQLVFPPEVATVFESVRRRTVATAVVAPDSSSYVLGASGFAARVFATAFHHVTAEIQRVDGTLVRTLYVGPMGDSLQLEWDFSTTDGTIVGSDRYVLSVASSDERGSVVRVVRLTLDVLVERSDTLLHPAPLADSSLLLERQAVRPGIESLVGGVLFGAAMVGLSSALAPDGALSGGRYALGVAIGMAGIAGFLQQRPGRAIPLNIAVNDSVRQAWREAVREVVQENAKRRSEIRFMVRTATPVVIYREQ